MFLGLWLTSAGRRTRLVIPFSAGVLLGVVFFGLLPELVEETGWPVTVLFFAVGYGLLFWINRHVAPVCPSCAHDHDHGACDTALHGFAAPLIGASMLHSFFDGWSVATVQLASHRGIRLAVALAVALHKIPEGMALGAIVRASVASRATALFWSVSVEAATLVGGVLGLAIAPRLGTAWITYPLGDGRRMAVLPGRARRPRGVEAARSGARVRYRPDRRSRGRGVAAGRRNPGSARSTPATIKIPLAMSLRFYNTLTQQTSEFAPRRDNTVRMYTCGPTVYDFAHIGNFRTFTFYGYSAAVAARSAASGSTTS